MQFDRRAFFQMAAGLAAIGLPSTVVRAEDFPSRSVRIIVGYAAGGTLDIVARLIGQQLTDRTGQQFVIENRGGAGGSLGAETVIRSTPDGYTIHLCNSADIVNAILDDKLSFNYIRDTVPIASVANGPLVLVVPPSFPAKTVAEFVAYTRANPEKVSYGSAGIGTVPHMAGELFKAMAKVDMVHVPYRGLAPAITDLLSGQIQAVFSSMPPAIEQIKAGKLRAIAVTSKDRVESLPDIQTIGAVLPGYEATLMVGLTGPKGTPAVVIEKLHKEINAALADPAARARMLGLGVVPAPMSQADFGKLISAESEKWSNVIKVANIKGR